MDEIIKMLKSLPKQILLHIVYNLIREGKITYHELTLAAASSRERSNLSCPIVQKLCLIYEFNSDSSICRNASASAGGTSRHSLVSGSV